LFPFLTESLLFILAVFVVYTDFSAVSFSNSKRDVQTLFEKTAADLGIRHKLIRPYTPRHNGKVERSHREDQKRFYSVRSFFSLADFQKQLAVHNRSSNNLPMRPLSWLSPIDFLVQFV
ncbi:integrase core domain-containing protein, partial [Flintibacter muris]|uniref:integrase core domain-containing protein n=1 Tax=Flintibacter muris TaxID=2941327 RepID=UPI002041DCAE